MFGVWFTRDPYAPDGVRGVVVGHDEDDVRAVRGEARRDSERGDDDGEDQPAHGADPSMRSE